MPTTHVVAESDALLQDIADSLWKSRKIVVMTGAGISTNSGIPDFRSENGLYSLIQAQFDAAAKQDAGRPPAHHDRLDGGNAGQEGRPTKRRRLTREGDSIEVMTSPLRETRSSSAEVFEDESSLPAKADEGEKARGGIPPRSAPRPSSLFVENNKQDPHNAAHDVIAISPRSSLRSSPPPAASAQGSDHTGTPSLPPSPSHKLPPPSKDIDKKHTSISRPSPPLTPHPLSDSEQPNISLSSSPLSSPPPVLFDPYEGPLVESSSPTRPSSPAASEGGNSLPPPRPQLSSQTSSRSRASLPNLKGRDLFDANIWSDPLKTSVFYTFTTTLRQKSRDATPTSCHYFLGHLRDSGRLVRCYTQNIDQMEEKVGLATEITLGPGSKGRFSTKAWRLHVTPSLSSPRGGMGPGRDGNPTQNNSRGAGGDTVTSADARPDGRPASVGDGTGPSGGPGAAVSASVAETINGSSAGKTNGAAEAKSSRPAGPGPVDGGVSKPETPQRNGGVECVFLHGSLHALRCFQCGGITDWDEGDREMETMSGRQPACPRCEGATVARQERGKRALGVGKLRPDIVLYGEEHPNAHLISPIVQHDLSLSPDMLLIMGTSLRVHGLKVLVKEFAKAVHTRGGKVVFVNLTKPSESVWSDVIDFWVQLDCDAWVHDLKRRKPILWLPPGSVDETEIRGSKRRRESGADSVTKGSEKKPKKAEVDKPPRMSNAKRPMAMRDDKTNGAYLTMKIMADLARLSGREIEHPTIKKTPMTPRVTVSTQNTPSPRRPRLKNARSRKSAPAVMEKIKKSKVEKPKPLRVAALRDNNSVQDEKVLPKLRPSSSPVLSSVEAAPGPLPELDDEENFILAAVKSHPRIRRPKMWFGDEEPSSTSAASSRRSTPSSSGGIKAKTQRKTSVKAKATHPPKAHKVTPILPPHIITPILPPHKITAILPPPRPHPQPPPSYKLPASIFNPADFKLPPLKMAASSHMSRPAPRPRPLEPLPTMTGPLATISTNIPGRSPMSPYHWRKNAFSFCDPLIKRLETPPLSVGTGSGVDMRQLGAVESSPNKQLQRENEAALTLSFMRNQNGF